MGHQLQQCISCTRVGWQVVRVLWLRKRWGTNFGLFVSQKLLRTIKPEVTKLHHNKRSDIRLIIEQNLVHWPPHCVIKYNFFLHTSTFVVVYEMLTILEQMADMLQDECSI